MFLVKNLIQFSWKQCRKVKKENCCAKLTFMLRLFLVCMKLKVELFSVKIDSTNILNKHLT